MTMTPVLFFCLLGLALVALELIVFQLSVFWLLFIGSGALLASGLGWLLGIEDWSILIAFFVVASALLTLALYRPLKRWQNAASPIAGNDAIGQEVRVVSAISANQAGAVQWSGSEWPAALADDNSDDDSVSAGELSGVVLAPGDKAYIVKLEGIRLFVSSKRN